MSTEQATGALMSYDQAHALRMRNTLLGIDPEIRPLILVGKREEELTEDESRRVRQAAHRWSAALRSIRTQFPESGDPSLQVLDRIFQIATEATEKLPEDEPELAGEQISVGMCQMIAFDYFIHLGFILDARYADDAKAIELIRARLARAFAKVSLRGPLR